MSMEGHVSELKRRHRTLDGQLNELMSKPGHDPTTVSSLKRRKLHLKDEIASLEASPRKDSVH